MVAVLLLAGCGPVGPRTPPPTISTEVTAPTSSPRGTAKGEGATGEGKPGSSPFGLPEAESPCERAKRWVARARELRRQGWIRRAARLLEHGRTACPAADDETLRTALQKARQPAPGSTAADLEREVGALLQAGDPAEARIRSAQWLTRWQATGGEGPRAIFRPEAGRVVGGARDGSAVIVATEPATSSGRPRTSTLTVLDGASGRPTHVIEADRYVHHADVAGGRLLAVSSDAVGLWSLATGEPLRRLTWAGERYRWAAFVGAGRRVVAVGEDGRHLAVRLFDVATGTNLGHVGGEDTARGEAAALIDDRRLVALGDAQLYVIDLTSFRITARLDPSPAPQPRAKASRRDDTVAAVAASRSGLVAAGLRRGTVVVWRLGRAQPAATFDTKKRITALELDAEGKHAFAGLEQALRGELRTYDVASGRALRSREVRGSIHFVAAGERVLRWGRRGGPMLEDRAGEALWPAVPPAAEIEAVRLSRGVALAHERRRGTRSSVHFDAWHGGRHRSFEAEGYRSDVFGLSPSGRQLAAVVSRKAWLWDLGTGRGRELPTPQGDGFPDGIVFGGEGMLRAIFERPAATWSAKLPFEGWKAELAPGELEGFRGTALSVRGDAVTVEDGRLVLAATGQTLVASGTGDFAFSGDGAVLFAGSEQKLSWFSPRGEPLGHQALPCQPRRLGVDHPGELAVFWCDRRLMTYRPKADRVATAAYGPGRGYVSVEAVHVSPSGALVAVHEKKQVGLLAGPDLQLAATLSLRAGEPLLTTPDGRLAGFSETPAWLSAMACRVGHRVVPIELCRDALTDDALLETLLAR